MLYKIFLLNITECTYHNNATPFILLLTVKIYFFYIPRSPPSVFRDLAVLAAGIAPVWDCYHHFVYNMEAKVVNLVGSCCDSAHVSYPVQA